MNNALDRFRSHLDDLLLCPQACAVPRIPLVMSSPSRSPYLADESLPTHLQCMLEAEEKLRAYYKDARNQVDRYLSPDAANGTWLPFRNSLTGYMAHLRTLLGETTEGEHAGVVSLIYEKLDPGPVLKTLKNTYDSLAKGQQLPAFLGYLPLIEYTTYDPSEFETGVFRLLVKAFSRFGYTTNTAAVKIRDDAQEILDGVRRDFIAQANSVLAQEVIEPIKAILRTLQVPEGKADD